MTTTFDIVTGDVIEYTDQGTHTALVLCRGTNKSYLLFATTNSEWNPRSRELTDDEYALLGWPKKRATYFAPVIRDNEHMHSTGKSFPIHRIKELQEEFNVIPELLIHENNRRSAKKSK